MKRFICPYCQAHLNLEGNIVLAARCDSNEKGLILLSDKLGDYSVHVSDNLHLNQGDRVQLHCPACHHSLEYKKNNNLARIFQIDEDGKEHVIIFSAIFGEHSTYQINELRTMTYGENALRYMDPDWLKKV